MTKQSAAAAKANPLRNIQQAQWMSYWQNIDGKRKVRSFNVSKYGEEGARQLAIRARQEGMEEVARQLRSQAMAIPDSSTYAESGGATP